VVCWEGWQLLCAEKGKGDWDGSGSAPVSP
jgi:hypothetical protein